MDGWTRFRSCDRSREAVSRALDGDLSPFEAVRLAAHLDACADCRGFQASIAATTVELRTAPVERPDKPITLPRRRALRPLPGSAAAAMAAAAILLLAVTAPVNLERGASKRLAAPAADFEVERVPDGDTLPGDYGLRVDRAGEPIPG